MEQASSEMHLSRIRDVKDLTALSDDARDVVKEEVILESSGNQLETKVRMVNSSSENSGGSGGVVSVPVSLPIGSMIAGAAFNMITPDQLPHFKQMLCVDNNGYISGGTVMSNMSGDLKTIVIQQQQQQDDNGVANHDATGSNNSHDSTATADQVAQGMVSGCGTSASVSWSDNYGEIIKIRCKTTSAELYRSKLGSGGRGRCVKYKDKWLTPSEFEQTCGRGSSKDWKRSIKSEKSGKSLQSLIDEGHLTPHATNCSCTVCCDDEGASGPVRLFTPYKRRKRNQTDADGESGPKRKRSSNNNNNNSNAMNNIEPSSAAVVVDDNNMFLTDENITSKDEPWPTLNDSLDTSTELVDQTQIGNPYDKDTFVVNINDSGSIAMLDNSQTMKTLESVYCTMVKATNDFKRILTDLKYTYDRRIEILQKERDAAVAAMRVQMHTDLDDPNISGSLHGNELISAKKCANCNRDALAECSLCRKTPYCSEFCQRKDWNAHQVECTRNPAPTSTQQIMLLVDEQS